MGRYERPSGDAKWTFMSITSSAARRGSRERPGRGATLCLIAFSHASVLSSLTLRCPFPARINPVWPRLAGFYPVVYTPPFLIA